MCYKGHRRYQPLGASLGGPRTRRITGSPWSYGLGSGFFLYFSSHWILCLSGLPILELLMVGRFGPRYCRLGDHTFGHPLLLRAPPYFDCDLCLSLCVIAYLCTCLFTLLLDNLLCYDGLDGVTGLVLLFWLVWALVSTLACMGS